MDYRLSKGDWKIIGWVAFLIVAVLLVGAVGEGLTSEKSGTTNASTPSNTKVTKSKGKGSKIIETKVASPSPVKSESATSESASPEPIESSTPQPTETRSEYYFDWPPTASTRVSGEGGETIVGNWKQVPGNANWYYLIEDEWYSCGGGSSYCQLTWWVSNQECVSPKPMVEFVRADGQVEGGGNWHGRYSKPYFAVWGFAVLIGSPESTYRKNKVIPEKDKYTIKSMSCN